MPYEISQVAETSKLCKHAFGSLEHLNTLIKDTLLLTSFDLSMILI